MGPTLFRPVLFAAHVAVVSIMSMKLNHAYPALRTLSLISKKKHAVLDLFQHLKDTCVTLQTYPVLNGSVCGTCGPHYVYDKKTRSCKECSSDSTPDSMKSVCVFCEFSTYPIDRGVICGTCKSTAFHDITLLICTECGPNSVVNHLKDDCGFFNFLVKIKAKFY